jgi:hypothetical protein
MTRLAFLLVVAAMALTCVGRTQAAFFQGTTSADFMNPKPAGTTTTITNGVPTSTFTSGAGTPNILTLTGTSFDFDPETPFNVAQLSYHNGVTNIDSAATDVDVNVILAFTAPFGGTKTCSFTFHFEMTPNGTGDPVKDADTLTPVNVYSQQTFSYGGETYILKLLGFSDGSSIVNSFVLPESRTVTSDLVGVITTNIPEPSILVLLGMGAMGLLSYTWRRRKRIT